MQKIRPSLFSIHFICFNLVHLLEISFVLLFKHFQFRRCWLPGVQSPAAQGSEGNARSWHTVAFLSEGIREKALPISFDSFLLYSPSVFPRLYFPGDFLFSFLMFLFSFC